METSDPKKPEAERLVLSAPETELLRGGRRPTPTGEDAPELHVCMACGSDLVYPTEWAPATAQAWSVVLRCPECESRREGVFGQVEVDSFDETLERGAEALFDDLTKLTHANFADEIDHFVDALARDLILPEDF